MRLADPSRFDVALLVLGLSLVGCGGVQSGLSGDGGADQSSAETGSGPCPGQAPNVGDSCEGTLECEYGSDPDVRCDVVVVCKGGQWANEFPAREACATTNPATCPASFSDVGKTCSPVDITCVYPEARCSCSTHCGPLGFIGDGGPIAEWCCLDAPPSTPGCPSPRPRVGSACTAASSVTCDYGFCEGNVALQCDDGSWQPDTMLGCPG
jgi:hypothetical protein